MIYLTAQPVNKYFLWQLEIQIRNLKKNHPKRWDLALIYLNVIFDLVGYSTEQRAAFCRKNKDFFFNEFNFDKNARLVLKNKFSRYYTKFHSLISDCKSLIYLDYKEKLSDDFEKLQGLFNLYPSTAVYPILSSIVHMELNRIFLSRGREKEAIIYYLLDRYYARQLHHKDGENI